MTAQLEKIFFNYILHNKNYFEIVKPYFFRNTEIKFVYDVIRNYIISSKESKIPTPRQIFDMVSIQDKNNVITKDILKKILQSNLKEYSETDFIIPNFNLWLLRNRIKTGAVDIVDETRGLDEISNFDSIVDAANRIKNIADEMSSTKFINDDDLGSDFDDVEAHLQDSSRFKVKSGFNTIDHMLGGGWDIQTLNVIMAQTNGGKSLWMQNFAVTAANMGYNVLYITLEMSERKVMKRLGSMRLKIPINEYDTISKDIDLMKKKINSLKNLDSNNIFENKVGKIYAKFWAAGTATVNDFDNYLKRLNEKRGIKVDLIIVDYITLIAPIKGTTGDTTLYSKGKQLAEGLRALGAKYTCPVITGVQVSKDAWNASDITLESVPESKAIAETADTFWAIIRTEEMKRHNLYRFKLLKQRDGDFLRSQILINLNPIYLTLEDDKYIDQ